MSEPARLRIRLDSGSAAPVFEQICDAVRRDIAFGRLPAGTRLPTTRALAAEIDVAVNTVAMAYRVLELEGVIEGRGRQGTFVIDPSGTAAEREALRCAQALRDLGVSRERALDLLARAWGS